MSTCEDPQVAALGGQPLRGSGFEGEQPDPDFITDRVPEAEEPNQ